MSGDFIPVFSGGTGRSGTTVIANALHRHPDFHSSMPREIRYLTDRAGLLDLNFGRPLAFESTAKELRNRLLLNTYLLFGKSKKEIFKKRMHQQWWSQMGKSGNPRGLVQAISLDQLDEAFDSFDRMSSKDFLTASQNLFFDLSRAQLKGKTLRYFADSTPLNIQSADRISALLPGSLFINMVRDGRDVALSVSKEKWGPNTPEAALEWWKGRIEKSFLALKKIPQENHITIRLEDFIVREREATYAKVLHFLQLPENEKLRKYYEEFLTQEKMSQGNWKTEVKNPTAFHRRYVKILDELLAQGIEIKQYY